MPQQEQRAMQMCPDAAVSSTPLPTDPLHKEGSGEAHSHLSKRKEAEKYTQWKF